MYIDHLREHRQRLVIDRDTLRASVRVHEAAEAFAKTPQWAAFAESLAETRTSLMEKLILQRTNDRDRTAMAAQASLCGTLANIPQHAEIVLPQMREQLQHLEEQIAALDRKLTGKEGGPDA